MKEKDLEFAAQLDLKSFTASNGWIDRLKKQQSKDGFVVELDLSPSRPFFSSVVVRAVLVGAQYTSTAFTLEILGACV